MTRNRGVYRWGLGTGATRQLRVAKRLEGNWNLVGHLERCRWELRKRWKP